jgi:anti-anti-sigma factor
MATNESRRRDSPDTVEVRVLPRALLISLIGEHDLSTRNLLFDAVARGTELPRMVIDLAECSFLDSSILGVLFSAHAQCERIAIVLPASDNIVHRTIGVSGVRNVMPVFETLEEAFRSVAEPGRHALPDSTPLAGRLPDEPSTRARSEGTRSRTIAR